MTQEKLNTIVKLVTAGAVVLLSILIISLTYQFIVLGNLRSKKANLEASISALTNDNVELNNQLEYFSNQDNLEDYYRSNGYAKDGDILFK